MTYFSIRQSVMSTESLLAGHFKVAAADRRIAWTESVTGVRWPRWNFSRKKNISGAKNKVTKLAPMTWLWRFNAHWSWSDKRQMRLSREKLKQRRCRPKSVLRLKFVKRPSLKKTVGVANNGDLKSFCGFRTRGRTKKLGEPWQYSWFLHPQAFEWV